METTAAQKLAEQFEAQIKKCATGIVPSTEEIEYKHVLDFSSDNEAKAFAADNDLKYPTEFIIKALQNEGFVTSNEESTKNLSSYYYDTIDRALNALGISLRMRHNETMRCERQSSDFESEMTDLSFKIPTQDGSTVKRLEYQAKTSDVWSDTGRLFNMSFKGLVSRYTKEIMERSGAQAALNWAKATHDVIGFDWNKYREHFSINCKRTKPYVTLYTLKGANDDLIRNEDGSVKTYKQIPEIIPKGAEVRKVVWQFCLDTNRFFATDPNNPERTVKYHVDHEVEYELQVEEDEYETSGALSSSKNITYEEVYAARAVINDEIQKTMKAYGAKECLKNSGKSKQERGFNALDEYNKNHPDAQLKPTNEFTIRGRTNLHKITPHTWEEMVNAVPILRDVIKAVNGNRPKWGQKIA